MMNVRSAVAGFGLFLSLLSPPLHAASECTPRPSSPQCNGGRCVEASKSPYYSGCPLWARTCDIHRPSGWCNFWCHTDFLVVGKCDVIPCSNDRDCRDHGRDRAVCAFGLCAQCRQDNQCPQGERCRQSTCRR
jgi:hypothetical protein